MDSMCKTMTDLVNLPDTTVPVQCDPENGAAVSAAWSNSEELDGALKPCNFSSSPVDGSLRTFLADTKSVYSPNCYVRRRKSKQLEAEINFTFPSCERPSNYMHPTVA